MNIVEFADLLRAAEQQAQPQRLLMVFVSAELPADATAEERRRFESGEGGNLRPVLCVDKLPAELTNFPALRDEAARTGINWDLVFVAGLSGRGGVAPSSEGAEQPLKQMVAAIESGSIGQFLGFDRDGQVVAFY